MLRCHRLPFAFHTIPDPAPDDDAPPIDYRPAFGALGALLAWACDVARARSPEPDDREAIDRVERSGAMLLAGQRAGCLPPTLAPSQADVLITASALIDAFAVDFAGPGLRDLVGAAYAAIEWTLRSAPRAATPGVVGQLIQMIGAWVPRGPRVAHAAPANDNACAACGARGR